MSLPQLILQGLGCVVFAAALPTAFLGPLVAVCRSRSGAAAEAIALGHDVPDLVARAEMIRFRERRERERALLQRLRARLRATEALRRSPGAR